MSADVPNEVLAESARMMLAGERARHWGPDWASTSLTVCGLYTWNVGVFYERMESMDLVTCPLCLEFLARADGR